MVYNNNKSNKPQIIQEDTKEQKWRGQHTTGCIMLYIHNINHKNI